MDRRENIRSRNDLLEYIVSRNGREGKQWLSRYGVFSLDLAVVDAIGWGMDCDILMLFG